MSNRDTPESLLLSVSCVKVHQERVHMVHEPFALDTYNEVSSSYHMMTELFPMWFHLGALSHSQSTILYEMNSHIYIGMPFHPLSVPKTKKWTNYHKRRESPIQHPPYLLRMMKKVNFSHYFSFFFYCHFIIILVCTIYRLL